MKLKRFRVISYRSVDDSGWIDTGDVTALIGTNEAGKTNLLLPLWKLNPAREGEIQPTADYPRKLYNTIRNQDKKPTFIEAIFEPGADLASKLSELTGSPEEDLTSIYVSRGFDGGYTVGFRDANPRRNVDASEIRGLVAQAEKDIEAQRQLKTEQALLESILNAIRSISSRASDSKPWAAEDLKLALDGLGAIKIDDAPKTSAVAPRFKTLVDRLSVLHAEISRPHPQESAEARAAVIKALPKFVYYSNYGNLDSEIYLPHVIANLSRTDLGAKEAAKARTLRVLFKFVQLRPAEIHELGKDITPPGQQPTPAQVSEIAEKKKQRSILLQSASTLLTGKFRQWWKQGDYRFRFEADGDHFRIWVADDRRPEEVELEGRSTGLQWFLSFYLVFLVESEEAHANAILLLDEPGLSLHPLSQRDLSAFFNGLAAQNQLIYTTHSPFLVDANHLDRARKVFVASDGTTKASSDLRAADADASQKGAGYAVYAALGLSVAESVLLGCKPIIVEGPSDTYYLTAMKVVLVSQGRLKPDRDIVFPPSGGVRGIKAVVGVLGCREDELPVVLVDSDSPGKELVKHLRGEMYAAHKDRVLEAESYCSIPSAEIEDLMPSEIVIREIDRWQRGADTPFSEVHASGKPIIGQIEQWAKSQNINLEPGWKVELAKKIKQHLCKPSTAAPAADVLDRWATLFEKFLQ